MTGVLAAMLALMWRKYLAQIGVRPVDLAVDPATRLADTIAAAMLFLGVFGPLLLILRWLDLAADLVEDHPRLAWMARRRALSGIILGLTWLMTALVLVLTILSVEVLVVGPNLEPDGVDGVIAPKLLGFGVQPMQAFDVDGDGPPRELLYLGGNADLYVLVDPCREDTVEFVSVGSTRLVVIDEVSCAEPSTGG